MAFHQRSSRVAQPLSEQAIAAGNVAVEVAYPPLNRHM